MNLNQLHSVYLLGIGGIGMSALAKWFKHRGLSVAGYDRLSTPLTLSLQALSIEVHFEDNISQLSEKYIDDLQTLVIYTPAIPASSKLLKFFKAGGFQVKKRSQVLGMITRDHFSIAIAGTHGKTTTSSMVAHVMHNSTKDCSAFVGGVMTNYNTNLLMGAQDGVVVVEADEFDRSFLQLSPDFTVVTSLDPDHLDIYGNADEMTKSYLAFIDKTHPEGEILLHKDVSSKLDTNLLRKHRTYGLQGAEITAKNIRVQESKFVFDYAGAIEIKNLNLALPGFHNVENAVAAITAVLDRGVEPNLIKKAIESYRGVKRRFEFIVNRSDLVFIDDYAHHPNEIDALLRSVKKLYPDKKITVIFQPHLFSRTRDFHQEFAEKLSLADEIILLDIYPAREQPIPGIDANLILDNIVQKNKKIVSLDDFPMILKASKIEVLLTVGAGSIDTLVPIIKSFYT
ncbi:MAG: UDP-N-acetylmuramate--L-alanine ligase [Flammeovirgaceae bacterium]|nr:UDP-N-acetylmuramate--L-alanine ligase [Flammeovirgaceae bacterium]